MIVLLKLVSIQLRERDKKLQLAYTHDWAGWDKDKEEWFAGKEGCGENWTYQQLAHSVGISTSECHAATKRCLQNKLLQLSRQTQRPIPVIKHVEEFCIHGLKYVFPTQLGSLVRGIPTTYAAPVLVGKLFSAGEHSYVWPDGYGKQSGIALLPIHPSVPRAVRDDLIMYELLALIDAMRVGRPREATLAQELFSQRINPL